MRVIRIFQSSPADVDLERADLRMLVRDINDTIQFLAPEQQIRLELVDYETHAFPDVGRPQDVIDRQIPLDFDIYLGIMWKRCGTPTGAHPSGTVHEFEQALAHREREGWPTIMFFFCDDTIEMPNTADEIDQLREVVRFRERLSKIGYTVAYTRRPDFREVVRGRLLRALADVITKPVRRVEEHDRRVLDEDSERRLYALTSRYDETRATMPSGPERTRAMTGTFHELVGIAAAVRPLLPELQQSRSAGERLAAIAVLNAFPEVDELTWLADRLDNPVVEAPFIGFQAAMALTQAVRSLPLEYGDQLEAALSRALHLAQKLPQDADRIVALRQAQHELVDKQSR